jgi:hypothetical protein
MPIKWKPIGQLDVQSDPLSLPETGDAKNIISGAMTQCTNLTLESSGKASTRRGTSKAFLTTCGFDINLIHEQAGSIYSFSGGNVYKDAVLIASGLSVGLWSAVTHRSYNSSLDSVFCLNGTNVYRITGSTFGTWGIDAPTIAPVVAGSTYGIVYTYYEDSGGTVVCESVASPIGYFSGWPENLRVAWDASTEANVTGIIIYRTLAGGSVYYRESTHPVENLTATLTSNLDTSESPPSSCSCGITAPVNAPYLTVMSGEYGYVYTYCRKVDGVLEAESNPSPTITLASRANTITWTVPSDAQVTHVRIYRTLAGYSQYYYDSEHVASTGSATLTADDTELGSEVSTEHDPPPTDGSMVFGPNYQGVLFMLVWNKLYYSLPQQPEYWPALNYIDVSPVDQPLISGCFFGGQVFVASEDEIWQIQGTGASSFFPLPMSATTGTKSRNCFCGVQGVGIYHLGSDGVYLYRSGRNDNITKSKFDPLFRQQDCGLMPYVRKSVIANCWMIFFNNCVYFGYTSAGFNYPYNLMVFDTQTGSVVHYEYAEAIQSVCYDTFTDRLLAGCTDGYIRKLEANMTDLDDGNTPIVWQIQTKQFGAVRTYFPRWSRYDIDLPTDSTASVYTLLNDVVEHTHVIPVGRYNKRRLLSTCAGERLSMRASGTGPVDIYSMEIE